MRILFALFVLITLSACSHRQSCNGKTSCTKDESCSKVEAKQAVAYDGHCAMGMCEKKKVLGSGQYKVDYKGKCYFFSSAEARDRFISKIEQNIQKSDAQWEMIGQGRAR
jgi:YHS domain-containing protein